ncbi:MAG TPA: 3-oxoacyl-ACP synthase [Paracoccus sp. (in: a-proteobacteria)]|uniref:3-oxoacyl-ACP synthase n=1 Tax=Paracoccus sp. TaxID=267 RepID=UPI002BE1AC56|nr:3-oxoacyl-ACP synthase [Paracoccus sp. (in: a-proteobacteria)]HWL56740.1 3-oxoacyl-ACP synthase [Paracoccus sp. (in: a-proteobacteria)]
MIGIEAAGMVTAVGLDWASASAALRARLDGFAETRFVAPGGWRIGAGVPLPRNWIGPKRMAHLAAGAIADILRQDPAARDAALILCLAEESRPGRPVTDPPLLLKMLSQILGLPERRAHLVAHGRPSGFVALDRARRMIASGEAGRVIVLGLDSYLTGPAIAHYGGLDRLLADGNPDGFIPGEAAAAVLLGKGGPLRLTGLGLAREAAFLGNARGEDGADLPLRADGMVAAYRAALTEAECDLAHVEYRIADLTGEQHFFKQTALVTLRLERGRTAFQDLWSPAEGLGNIGAAVVPAMLGMALAAVRKGYAPGSPVLIEASGDDGACGAAVLHEVRGAVRRASVEDRFAAGAAP